MKEDEKPNEHGADDAQGAEDSDSQDENYQGNESGSTDTSSNDPGVPEGPGKGSGG